MVAEKIEIGEEVTCENEVRRECGREVIGHARKCGDTHNAWSVFLSRVEERRSNLEGDRQADPLGNSRHLPLLPGQPVPTLAPAESPVPSALKPRSVCLA